MTEFFIKRPVVAIVLNVMIAIMGLLAFKNLNVREYPNVTFPNISVQTGYSNASAELVEESLTNTLEETLSGVEGLDQITSVSSYGSSQIYMKFKNSINLDQAMSNVRDAVSRVSLPTDADAPTILRSNNSEESLPFMIILLKTDSMSPVESTHYATLNFKNTLRTIAGVSYVSVDGPPYTFEINLDPQKLYAFGINADEVYSVLFTANKKQPFGKFQNEVAVKSADKLETVADYNNLVIRQEMAQLSQSPFKNNLSSVVRLKDLAEVNLTASTKGNRIKVNGAPAVGIYITESSEANALEVSREVHEKINEINKLNVEGVKLEVFYDKAEFIRKSLSTLRSSIVEGIFLVIAIVFLFLRNIKATLVPLVTIPISLVGSLLFLSAFGFSINVMTLLAMVLGIGLVVDDAIVMLENIQRYVEKGCPPLKASIHGSKEISFAIIAMTLTLTSVYAPLAFIQGTIGKIFIEFAASLAGSVLISGVVALTLTPLMCSRLLKHSAAITPNDRIDGGDKRLSYQALFHKVDYYFTKTTEKYQFFLSKFLDYKKTCAALLLGTFIFIVALIKVLPSELMPKEDREMAGIFVPPGDVMDVNKVEKNIQIVESLTPKVPEARSNLAWIGNWGGHIVYCLKPLSERSNFINLGKKSRSASQISDDLKATSMAVPSLDAWPWSLDSGMPGIKSDGSGSGLEFVITTSKSYQDLFTEANKIKHILESSGGKSMAFTDVRHELKLNTKSYDIKIDKNKMASLLIKESQVTKAIEIFFGGNSTIEFTKDGVTYNLTVQARMPEDSTQTGTRVGNREKVNGAWSLDEIYITNSKGKRISVGSFAEMALTSVPKNFAHHQQMRAVSLFVGIPPGAAFDDANDTALEIIQKNLSPGFKVSVTGQAKTFKESQGTMALLIVLAVIFIYAILSIQFNNFIDPIIIMLTVPLAVLGGLFLTWICGGSINIYTQVGLITLIGLITKHGILIVEFSNQQLKLLTPMQDNCLPKLKEALIKAATLRLRPILMTTGAMVLGALPLIISASAGYESRRAIGIMLVGGLLFGTLFTLFVLPTVCLIVKQIQMRGMISSPSRAL